MNYVVPVKWVMYSCVVVDAESAQEAFDMVDDHNFDTNVLYEKMEENDFVFFNSEISADDEEPVTDENRKQYFFNKDGILISGDEEDE